MKKRFAWAILIALLLSLATGVYFHTAGFVRHPLITSPQVHFLYSGPYVGSVKSDKFHYPDCVWAHKIHPENLITFSTRQQALNAGYVPCKVCQP